MAKLLLNLEKSFLNSIFSFAEVFVLSPIHFFNQDFSLKLFSVTLLHLQTLNKILLEVLIRNYVSLLIIQVWHKLFNPIHQQPLRGKWIVIMIIMKLFSIFKSHLEDARC